MFHRSTKCSSDFEICVGKDRKHCGEKKKMLFPYCFLTHSHTKKFWTRPKLKVFANDKLNECNKNDNFCL